MGVFDAHVVSYLEMIRLPYTGCNPRGLMLARNKAIAKMIVRYHRIPAPRFHVFPLAGPKARVRKPKRLDYPLIVKKPHRRRQRWHRPGQRRARRGKLEDRVRFIHRQLHTDALVETFIPGRELYVGVIGNDRLSTLPPWEVFFDKLRDGAPKIATSKVKWDEGYQKKIGLTTGPAKDLPGTLEADLPKLAKRTYRALQLSGYCRMDFRITEDGKAYLLEANPNPQIMFGEDFAESAEHGGLGYEKLLEKIINLGTEVQARGAGLGGRRPRWVWGLGFRV